MEAIPLNLPCPECNQTIAMPTQWVEGMRMNCPKCSASISEGDVKAILKNMSEGLQELREAMEEKAKKRRFE
ncbi:MAG: hypothetical protein AAGB46_06500 [Verrucomicrobiota bacterium]